MIFVGENWISPHSRIDEFPEICEIADQSYRMDWAAQRDFAAKTETGLPKLENPVHPTSI
jgi:hypothetical protein